MTTISETIAFIGAGHMAAALIEGVIAAGIAQFDAAGLREIVARAVEHAQERGRELGAQARAHATAGPKGSP